MILSNYTFLFENDGEYYAFNALSKAFLEIDSTSYDLLLAKQKTRAEITDEELDRELFDEFKKRLFLCTSHQDEFLTYKAMIMNLRQQSSSMHLTIAPTMDCCFSCFYCFERDNKTKSYITTETMDAIIKNIERRENLQNLHLTWFGGEPLMAIDKMQEFYRKFRPVFKGKFSSNIITTAHHIDERVIDILKEIEVKSMQITIDGMEQTHNSVKFTEGCSNAFRRVLSNIDLLVEKYPELGIVVRVNTTKSNSAEYIELHNLIGKRYKGKVSMSPGLVMNRTNDPSVTNLFNREDFSRFSLDLWQKHRIVSSWLMYQNSPHSECAIRNRNALSVDPEGNVYQCWENIGNKKRTIGRLDSEGNLTDINQTELNRNLYGADPIATPKCIKCSYLPMCGGGCPIQRIQNEFEGTKNDICSSYKNHIKDWLLTYLELKKLGIMREKK